ncbi:MAG: outer membrane protein assembly factor BamD [Deltaproteobacteria bacterium]|nr:outer membrane protein assembly factor BamD [Deltaproteobacteria bacterium]
MTRRIVFFFLGFFILIGVSGCSPAMRRLSAKEYYTEASDYYNREDFITAGEKYQELLDQYPLNPYAEEAQLKIAYGRYLDRKFADALTGFSDFERTYPTSSHLPFVQYYRGMSYLDQMRSIDRDQSVTEKANDFFRAVSGRFGDSSFALLAEQKSRSCRESLAEHELYVAEFHMKRFALLPAKSRLRRVVEEYPETDAATKALGHLQEILEDINKKSLAELAGKALAARKAAKPASADAATGTDNTPPPEVDPLLALVTQLKKQEEEDRKVVFQSSESEKKDTPPQTPTQRALQKEIEKRE